MMAQDLTIVIIGSSAREHVISCAYEKSPLVNRVIVAPGNDFIAYGIDKKTITDKNCSLKDPGSILALARKYKPDLIDVAQDNALALGTVDLLQDNGFLVFGPTKQAARIEWDKRWSREFMQTYNIPHPDFKYFDDESVGKDYVQEIYLNDPNRLVYVKAAGLCAGKGALKSTCLEEAIMNIGLMKTFPDRAGEVFLIEEGLVGEEFSYYCINDGRSYHPFKSAQDNKTALNFDKGDQTGGMGAISPALVTLTLPHRIEASMVNPAIGGMAKEGVPFKGILYVGGIVTEEGIKNIEYNARWGDPECQAVLPSLETDYAELVMACIDGRLKDIEIEQDEKTRVCVVGASRGYPNDYSDVMGKRIYGIDDAMRMEGISVFGAGVAVQEGRFYANGGRLFSIVAEGDDILDAKQKAYSAMAHVSIEGNNLHYRTDIGWRDVERVLCVRNNHT